MAKEVKTPVKKATEAKKTPIKKKVSKGQALACEVCGLAVTVEEVGDMIVETDNVLFCCGKPMKEKVAAKKAVKEKVATKAPLKEKVAAKKAVKK